MRIIEFMTCPLSYFGGLNLGKTAAAVAIGQGALVHLQRTHPSFAKHTRTITESLWVLNFLGTCWTAGRLINVLQNRYNIEFYSPDMLKTAKGWSMKKVILFNGIGCVFIFLSVEFKLFESLSTPLRNALKHRDDLSKTNETVSWDAPDLYHQSRLFYLTQGILHLSLVMFGENRLASLIAAAGYAGTFYSSTKMEWVQLHSKNDARYEALLIPHPDQEDKWTLCPEGHYHDMSLIDSLAQQLLDFRDKTTKDFPHCSEKGCTQAPVYARCYDENGKFQGGNPSESPAILYLAYTTLQLYLAYIQYTTPQVARPIYNAQMALMMVDGARCLAAGRLSQNAFKILIAVSLLSFTYFFVMEKDVATIPKTFKDMEVKAFSPLSFKMMKMALITKTLLDLIRVSESQKLLPLFAVTALLSVMTLYYIAELQFFSIKRTLKNPLKDRKIHAIDHLELKKYRETVQAVTLDFEFINPSSYASSEESLQKIYDYTSDIFEDSDWWLYEKSYDAGNSFKGHAIVHSLKDFPFLRSSYHAFFENNLKPYKLTLNFK